MSDHGRFIWYELITSDMEGAKRFYGDIVGWAAQDMPTPGGAEPYAFLSVDGAGVAGMMNLGAPMKAEGMSPNWTAYICVDDCDAAAEKVKVLGGSVLRPPLDIPGIGRFAIVADPHGAVTAIMTPTPPPGGRPQFPRGTPGHGSWHELYAGDLAADWPFYAAMFGWHKTDSFDMGPMGVYQLFGNQDGQVGGMMTKPPEMPTPAWCYYFESPDVDTAAERIKAGGGKITNGPMDVPDGSRIVQAEDPSGAAFALVKTKL